VNKPTLLPIENWQFFQACKSYLGSATIQKLYKVSSRQIDRWCSDPDYTESNQKNPVDRYEALLSKLMALGHTDVARSFVRRQVRIVGCVMEELPGELPDKGNLPEEMLGDYACMHLFHKAIQNEKDELIIRKLRSELISEINKTFAFYIMKKNTK